MDAIGNYQNPMRWGKSKAQTRDDPFLRQSAFETSQAVPSESDIILLVEDDSGNAALIIGELGERGMEVVHVKNGQQAAQWLSHSRPKLILLDYSLPDMNGDELIDFVRDTQNDVPPFIVITGAGNESVAVTMMKHGAKDYLVKDINFIDALPLVVDQVLKQIVTDRQLIESEMALRESEARFRSVAQTASDVIITIDEDGLIIFWNEAAAGMFGYSVDEMIGCPVTHIMPERFHKPYQRARKQIVSTGKSKLIGQTIEMVGLRKGGGEFPIEISLSRWSVNERVFFTTILRDITERKRAEKELLDSHLRLSATMEALPNLLFELDRDGRIHAFHAPHPELLYLPPEEFLGKTMGELLPQEASAIISDALERATREGISFGATYSLPLPQGESWFELSVATKGDPRSSEARFIMLARDITERKQSEETLRRQNKKLSALQATMLEIAAPHDLTTLLHTIVERAIRLLDSQSGGMYLCDPERQTARCVVSYNTLRDYTGMILKYGEGAAGIVAREGKPLIIDDYRVWKNRAAAYEEEQPFTAVLSVPMIWKGEVIGVIEILGDVKNRRFSESDKELLELFASHAAIAVENTRLYEEAQIEIAQRKLAEEEILLSERRLRQIIDLVPHFVFAKDESGKFILVNKAVAEAYGTTVDNLTGKTDADFAKSEEEARQFREGDRTVFDSGEPKFIAEEKITDASGLVRVLSTQKIPFTFSGTDSPAVIGVSVDITEQKRAEDALRQQNNELSALQVTMLEISTPHDLPTLLHTIVERAATLLHGHSGLLYLCDPEQREARVVVSHDTPRDYTGTVLKYGEGVAGVVAQSGRSLLIDDYRVWENRAAVYEEEQPFTAVVGAPMTWKGQVTGVIEILDDVECRQFTESELDLLELFASHAAIAVENTRLYEEAQKEIGERTKAEEALVAQSQAIQERIRELDCLHGLSRLFEEKSDSYEEVLQGAVELLPFTCQYPELACARIFLMNEEFRSGNYRETSWKRTRPVFVNGQREGFIEVGYLESTAKDELPVIPGDENKLLEIIAERLGKVLERRRMEEELRYANISIEKANHELKQAFMREQLLSRTDTLTGICNRRFFFDLADLEFAAAKRYQRPLSMILFDIDHFKPVNDEFGHQVGDEVLKNVAHIAREQLRTMDILGRYGGEEFMVLLPNSSAQESAIAAERIRKSISAYRLATEGGEVKVTVSIGIAERSSGTDTLDQLITNADKAMYRAKDMGRDRIAYYE